MNIDEQRKSGRDQIQITDALNASLLELTISRNSYTQVMDNNLIIYVDKQDKTNPSADRKEYIFPLSRQLVYLYKSDVAFASDQFVMKLVVENNDIVMKTFVVRNVTDFDAEGNRDFASNPEIEELESRPIVLFEGTNYIYTNYSVDGMDMNLVYPKNTQENIMFLNSAIYTAFKQNHPSDFSLEDLYFKDAFTKTENKLNLEVDNANVECITSKNNKFSMDENGNLNTNSVSTNNLVANSANISSLTSQNNNFNLDSSGNLTVKGLNVNGKSINLLSMYPVGSIYMSVNSTNPSTYFGGTWSLWGAGKVPVGVDTSQSEFNSVEKTGGAKTVTLTTSQIPSHSHTLSGTGAHTHTYTGFIQCAVSSSATYTAIAHKRFDADGTSTPASMNSSGGHSHSIGNTGGSGAHNNLQPYITCYMWKRTA